MSIRKNTIRDPVKMKLCFCLLLLVPAFSSEHKKNYKLQFPKSGSAYAQLLSTLPLDLHEFTICYWMKINHLSRGANTILSYAIPTDDNEIRIYLEGHHRDTTRFGFDRKSQFTGKVKYRVHLAAWYHMCIVWSSWSGYWQIYLNGVKQANGSDLAQGHPVTKGGSLILGQDQDTVGGGFASKDALIGELLDLNIWDEILSEQIICDLSACLPRKGNVFSWLDSPMALHGGAVVAVTQLCESLMPHYPRCHRLGQSSLMDVAKDENSNVQTRAQSC